MDIAIAFDQNYLVPFYALISSIFDNNKKEKINFHCIIKDDVSEIEQDKILRFVIAQGCEIKFYKVDENLLSKFVISGNWTTSVYYKMFFPLLVSNTITKLLYLDTDMLVLGNLNMLFEIDLATSPLGAVYDNYVKIQPQLGILEEGNYFNSGMLLYNIPVWKERNISEKAVSFLTEFPEKIKFVDQCALNGVIEGDWVRLPEKYNLLYSYIPQELSSAALNLFMKDKIVVHFTLQRPWNFLCNNRLRTLYRYYLHQSPARNEKVIIDFSIDKIPAFLKLRIKEMYFDSKTLKKIWRLIK